MSDIEPKPSEAALSRPATHRRRRYRQFSVRTLLLVTAAIAVWTAYIANERHNRKLNARIAAMRPLAHELAVEDPNRIAVVKLDELWYDENIWDVYLPPGQYRLFLATYDIDQDGLAPVRVSAPLAGGRHRLTLEQRREESGWQVAVTGNDAEILTVKEPPEWDPARGSMGGGQFSNSTQIPADQPVVLFRRRFSQPTTATQPSTPTGPTAGVLLWIGRDTQTHSAP